MPVSRLLDQDTPDAAAKIMELVLGKIALARELTITRAGKNQPVLQRLSVKLAEGENKHDIAREAANEALDIAQTDAGGQKRTYVFSLWGDAPEDRMPPLLGHVTCRINEDDEDEKHPASTTKAATKLIDTIGDRYMRSLDAHLSLLERLLPMATQQEQLGAAKARAEGDTQIKLTELAIGREERQELLQLAVTFMPFWMKLNEGLTDWLRGKAEEARARAEETRSRARGDVAS